MTKTVILGTTLAGVRPPLPVTDRDDSPRAALEAVGACAGRPRRARCLRLRAASVGALVRRSRQCSDGEWPKALSSHQGLRRIAGALAQLVSAITGVCDDRRRAGCGCRSSLRWPEARPLRQKRAYAPVAYIAKLFCRRGSPSFRLSEQVALTDPCHGNEPSQGRNCRANEHEGVRSEGHVRDDVAV